MTTPTSRSIPDSAQLRWVDNQEDVDWVELCELYRIAPLGDKPPEILETVFANSRFKTFAYLDDRLVAAGRALADGFDCAYIGDVAVHPDHQGRGVGSIAIRRLVSLAAGHNKIILYANPGKEPFYAGLGFLPMSTAMAIWKDQDRAISTGLLRPHL